MTIIDERGRLFGKINLFDALVGFVMLALIPLAYGAYLLFRAPVPSIVSIEPSHIVRGKETSITLTGRNLRSFLRVELGIVPANLLVESPTSAEIKVPATIQPGTYDVALMDEARVLVRKPAALTVTDPVAPTPTVAPAAIATVPVAPAAAPPVAKIQLVGGFVGLERRAAGFPTLGMQLDLAGQGADVNNSEPKKAPLAVVLAVAPPEPDMRRVRTGKRLDSRGDYQDIFIEVPVIDRWRVPAILEVACIPSFTECTIGGAPITEKTVMSLSVRSRAESATRRSLTFFVDEVRTPDRPPVFANSAR